MHLFVRDLSFKRSYKDVYLQKNVIHNIIIGLFPSHEIGPPGIP